MWFGKTLLVEQMKPNYFDYNKADWKKFSEKCNQALDNVNAEGTIDEWSNSSM